MTEIPEHLLRRSRERRAALGGDEGTATEAAEAVTSAAPTSAAPVPAAAAPPAGVAAPPPVAEPPVKEVPRIGPTRAKVPIWIMPVLVALPLWAIVYMGAFGSRAKGNANDPVALGGAIFAANCSTCHGANGEGGSGPQLNRGEVLQVWPNVADHVSWVHTGGAPFVGKTIGATHIPVTANNVMPAFAGTLSDDQINQVVCYERVSFGGAPENAANCPGFSG